MFVYGEALLSKQVKLVIHFNKFTFDPISLKKLEQEGKKLAEKNEFKSIHAFILELYKLTVTDLASSS